MQSDTLSLSSAQLRQAADVREKIEELTRQLESILGGSSPVSSSRLITKSGRRMSAEGRARIAEAQRLRWAKARKEGGKPDSPGKKRTMSPEQRAKIAAAARLRWKKAKATGRNRL